MHERAPSLLVIEDARDQAVLVGVAARRAHPGLNVHICGDGREGIDYLGGVPPFDDRRAHPLPDLIILDLIMPEVDGFAVLEWLRGRPEPLGVPVAVLTASPKPVDEARARELGATDVFRKPTEVGELGEVVRKIVHRWIGRGAIIASHLRESG
jgi:two-component system, response regulator